MTRIDRLFKLERHSTNIRVESMAGLTTFLAMAYITVVNPSILSETGMDFGAVFVATCIAGAFGSIVMGLHGNYPIAQAPGMAQAGRQAALGRRHPDLQPHHLAGKLGPRLVRHAH